MTQVLMRGAVCTLALALAATGCAATTVRPEVPSGLVLADAVAAGADSGAKSSPREDAVQAEGGDPASRLDRRRALRTLGWIGLGVAAESLLFAIPSSILLLKKKGDLNADCNAQRQCTQAGLNEANSLPALTTVNTVSWILVAVGAGAGAVLLYTTRPDGSRDAAVSVAPSVGGAVVTGRF